jgi:hypothetical protein
MLQGGLGFAGAPAVEFAEPDWQQRWSSAVTLSSGYRFNPAMLSRKMPPFRDSPTYFGFAT